MKYSCEITINLPRDRVIELFDNPDNMSEWQEGLQSFEPFEGEPGTPGAKSRIHYKMGKRDIKMVETIVTRDLPNEFSATYETDGVWNIVENHFSETPDGKTEWHIDTEFKCSGFLKILAFVMPGMFKKQTQKMMSDFKNFAEGSGGGS